MANIPRDRDELKAALESIKAQGATNEDLSNFVSETKQARPNIDFSISSPIPQEIQKPGLVERAGTAIKEEFGEAEQISAEAQQKFEQGEFVEGAIKTATAGTKALLSPITGAVGAVTAPIVEKGTEAFKGALEAGFKKRLGEEEGQQAFNDLGEDFQQVVSSAVEKFDSLPSGAKTGIQFAATMADVLATVLGGKGAKKVVTETFEGATKLTKAGIGIAGEGIENVSKKVDDFLIKVKSTKPGDVPFEEKLIASTQKITPTKAIKFKELSGREPAAWLSERGIIGDRPATIQELSERWLGSKKLLDEGLSKMGGTFKDPSIRKILDEQLERARAVEDKALANLTKKRIEKFEADGLTPSEIINVKRDYERNTKLGYLKENNSIKVEIATNRDAELREFLIGVAEDQGFTNFRALSKELQQSRFLADAIAGKLQGQQANNIFGLTDNILLAGSVVSPDILAGLGFKKAITSEAAKAAAAKGIKKIKGKEATIGKPEIPSKRIELKEKQRQLKESL